MMHTESPDDKFGLPKPDFQKLPKKRAMWPILSIILLVAFAAIGKMIYQIYFKGVDSQNIELSAETTDGSTIEQATDTPASSPRALEATSEVNTNVSVEVNESVSGKESFNHKKSTKKKESISAVQKRLAEQKKRALVKPGTYQELREPQGIYHLVVVNHLDKPSAMKTVQQLMKKNLGVCLILPRTNKGEKYYRVTIGHSRTQYEADEKFKQFNPTYKNIFILKY